eukprot:GEZU01043221.1.p2 GENE.GEZU01043221.1~~GEZU01043221.1.p2  ORF type:complete len:109 (+),score=21.56 GEZU01043221.1:367-693(+)
MEEFSKQHDFCACFETSAKEEASTNNINKAMNSLVKTILSLDAPPEETQRLGFYLDQGPSGLGNHNNNGGMSNNNGGAQGQMGRSGSRRSSKNNDRGSGSSGGDSCCF